MALKKYSTFLFLEDGTIYQGWSLARFIISIGELVFTTGMTGYQEVITDPSYCEQIVLFTYPEIGNTGINLEDMESDKPYIRGVVAKNLCMTPSNWRSQMSFAQYVINNKISHLFGIDTRSIVKYLRDKGVMLACISSRNFNNYTLLERFDNFKKLQSFHLVDKVTTQQIYKWHHKQDKVIGFFAQKKIRMTKSINLNVLVLDFGVKFNILRRLTFYGCQVTVLPASSSYTVIMSYQPDGIILSNGPGDPSLIPYSKHTILQLIDTNIPLFGICLGHQLLSLACGGNTEKLKFGHRGLNHPAGLYDCIRITSQNHGFVVSSKTLLDDRLNVIDWNLNDMTVSGIIHSSKPFFSVQYHPEASPGPHDSDYLFVHFIDVIKKCKLSN